MNKENKNCKTNGVNVETKFTMDIFVVIVGVYMTIFAGMNNLILSPENSYPNIIGVLFGMFMQFLGLTLILNKLSLEHENILRELKLTKKLIKDE